jgi:phosphate-selective porin OprO and OprP
MNKKTFKKTGLLFFCTTMLAMFCFLILPPEANAQDFDIRGRLHMDAFWGLDDADDFSNGFNNRRARIGVNGRLTNKWDGRIEVDFADGGVSPNDFRLRRSFEHGGRLWLGQYKVPQGLNELTSSNSITFIERATNSNMIADSRRMGIAYEYFGSQGGLKTMIFGRALGQRGAIEGDMPLGVALRGVFAPNVAGGTLHLGGSVVYEDKKENISVGFSDRPEARDSKGGRALIGLNITDPNLNSTLKTGLEVAYLNGPFSVEAEYLHVNVDIEVGESPSFGGWHVQSSYVFGGSRSYSGGIFGGVRPDGEAGAWEIAARFSTMDLNDSGYHGGEQSNFTVALNRYVTSNLRFMFNVIFVDVEDRNPILGVMRAQYHF